MDIAWSEPFDPNSDSDKDAAQRFKEFYVSTEIYILPHSENYFSMVGTQIR